MYFTERDGRVRVVTDGELAGEPFAAAATSTAGETGFLGIAMSPAPDEAIYVFATDPDGTSNRVLRAQGGGELEPIVEGLPGGGYHNGGGLAFDDSGALFVSNGETHDSTRSQDPSALGGKVYRMTPDGRPLDDNPFGADSMTYALGLRNPYGLAIDPVSGDPFVTENGLSGHDEVDHIVAGGNYGWPVVEGTAGDLSRIEPTLEGRYQDPLLDYADTVVPTGITFADPDTSRAAFAGDLFFGTYGERTIHRVRLDDQRRVISDDIFIQDVDPVIAVAWGPRGLYYSTPTAIRLLPLAKGGGQKGPPAAADAPTGSGLRFGRIVIAVTIIAAAALTFAYVRRS